MSFTATSPSPRTAAPVIATAPRSNLRSPYRPCRQQTENRGRRGGELLGPRKPHKSLGVTFDFAPYAGEGRPLPPEPVAGATWQAGITPGNDNYRIFINGEPLPLCFAANPRQGWARVYELDANGNVLEKSWKTLYGRIEQRRTKF